MNQAERRALIIGVVENQLRDNNPPEARQTLERLLASGVDRDEALRLIACVVATEIFDVLKHHQDFDLSRYYRTATRFAYDALGFRAGDNMTKPATIRRTT